MTNYWTFYHFWLIFGCFMIFKSNQNISLEWYWLKSWKFTNTLMNFSFKKTIFPTSSYKFHPLKSKFQVFFCFMELVARGGNGQKRFLLLPFLVLKFQLFYNQRENRGQNWVGLKLLNHCWGTFLTKRSCLRFKWLRLSQK